MPAPAIGIAADPEWRHDWASLIAQAGYDPAPFALREAPPLAAALSCAVVVLPGSWPLLEAVFWLRTITAPLIVITRTVPRQRLATLSRALPQLRALGQPLPMARALAEVLRLAPAITGGVLRIDGDRW